jgi:restriction endonuclease S subunit
LQLVNGKIKQWQYFSQTIQNSSIPFVGSYLSIICALLNAYRTINNIDIANRKEWATQMLMLRDRENKLEKRLQQIERSEKKSHWKKVEAQMITFPALSENDVENICFGI